MLNVMRENLKSLKWVLWLVAASMTLYLGSYFFDSGSGSMDPESWAARVNDRTISGQRFLATARQIDRTYRELFGANYEQIKPQLRIGTQAIQELIERESMLVEAERLGLDVSKEELAERIRSVPGLQDEQGNFVGKERYLAAVQRAFPGGVAAFEQAIADDIRIEQWVNLVTQPVEVADSELAEIFRRRTEKTTLDYLLVLDSEQQVEQQVDEAEARQWYESHGADYERPEGRRVRFVVLEHRAFEDQTAVSADEVRQAYERDLPSYARPEQRRARHVLFRSGPEAGEDQQRAARARAEAVLTRLQAGESFDAIASAESEDPGSAERGGDLGFFGRGAMVPPFDAAVFGARPGDPPKIVETRFGVHVVELTEIREAGTRPFEEVEPEIRRKLTRERAQELVRQKAVEMRERLVGGEALENLSEKIERQLLLEGQRLPGVNASPEELSVLFDTDAGGVAPPIRIAGGQLLAVVDEVVPPGIAPFEEVRSEVEAAVLDRRRAEAAMVKARRTLERHKSLSRAARTLGLEVSSSGSLAPNENLPGVEGPFDELRAEVFGDSPQVGQRGVVRTGRGALLYEIAAREPFDPEAFRGARDDLQRETLQRRKDALRESAIAKLVELQSVSINDELVQRIDG